MSESGHDWRDFREVLCLGKMGYLTNRPQTYFTVGLVVLSMLAAGCGGSDKLDEGVSEALPCDPARQQVDLGKPRRSTLPAEVTLSGGTIWAKLESLTGGGGFTPVIDQAAFWYGPVDDPPQYESGTSAPRNASKRFSVHVDFFTEIDVDSGRYWVIQSQGGNLELFACEAGTISDALGVPLGPEGLSLVPAEILESAG